MINPNLDKSSISRHYWQWQNYQIAYETCGVEEGIKVIFVHGFGANKGHWRKNLPVLGKDYHCYALDLIGFGDSAKPTPNTEIDYTFETWGKLIADFCKEVVKEKCFLIGNSIGCVAIMQTAVDNPDLILGIIAINCSLRLLHDRQKDKLPFYKAFGSGIMQKILQNKSIGYFFFRQIAKPKVIKNILTQAYPNQEAITDELIELLYKPSQDKGAADVFLAFTSYSQGALPQDLLPILPCNAILLWGSEDKWEPIAMGQEFAKFATVKKFIPLEGLGHCPQDEAPEIVNPILNECLLELINYGQSTDN